MTYSKGRAYGKTLTKTEVETIFSLRREGLTHEKISERVGVQPQTVARILRGKTHKQE